MLGIREFTEDELLAALRCLETGVCADLAPAAAHRMADASAILCAAAALLLREEYRTASDDYRAAAVEQGTLADMVDRTAEKPEDIEALTAIVMRHQARVRAVLSA